MASSVPSMDEVESALEEGVEAASKHVSHPIKWFFFFVLVFTFLFAGPVNHVMGVREKPIAPQAAEIALSQPPPPPPPPVESTPQFSPPPPRSVASTPQIVPPRSTIAASTGAPRGIELDFGEHGSIRLFLRPEWCNLSATYAERVADAGGRRSTLYRLEPGFLVQGRLFGAGVPTLRKTPKAPKLMERGEVGWAGGGAGPDFFIYLGTGPATWLGNPHDGSIWADVADEASLAVANTISLLPIPPTKPGQMHILAKALEVGVTRWAPVPAPPRLEIMKVAGATIDAEAAKCAERCHVLPHTELHGGVVSGGWGSSNKKASAAECCDACVRQAEQTPGRACNVWVYCGSPACGKQREECWLKRADDLWTKKDITFGTSDRWTAGTMEAPPPDHPARPQRPTAAEAHLSIVIAGTRVHIKLREAIAPRAAARIKRALAAGGGAGCAVTAAAPTPTWWGDPARPDGFGAAGRWPAGAAAVEGTLGPAFAPDAAAAPPPVEPGAVAVARGAVAWASSGAATGDGPRFFIALADLPHLGVSHTVWGHVVEDDLAALASVAAEVAEGRRAVPIACGVESRKYGSINRYPSTPVA